jgi:hypothetical protein
LSKLSAPAPLNMLAPHGVQVAAAPREYVFTGQLVHSAAFAAVTSISDPVMSMCALKVPGTHATQVPVFGL